MSDQLKLTLGSLWRKLMETLSLQKPVTLTVLYNAGKTRCFYNTPAGENGRRLNPCTLSGFPQEVNDHNPDLRPDLPTDL